MTEDAKHDEDALLAHAGWVRALARHLTADAHTADDLAQDALAAALVRPPPSGLPLRSWLGAIVRNLARQDRRAAGRRVARERVAARDEVVAPGTLSLERLDSLRSVVDAVTRLEEPYRTAILMRYFEGLSPSAIAARTDTPLRTVHTRLHRALARLRVELDRAHGGERKAWLLALIPFARGSSWPELGAGALIVDAKLKIALAIVAVVGVCSTFVLWRSDAAPSSPPPLVAAPAATQDEAGEARDALVEGATSVGARRAEEAAPVAEPAPVAATAVATKKLVGRVIDIDRAPVARVKVGYVDARRGTSPAVEVETGADGTFEIDDAQSGGRLDVVSDEWASVYRPESASPTDAHEFVLVVARCVTLAGIVIDEKGTPLAGAHVAVPMPFGLRARFDAILDRSSTVEHAATTDERGHFELKRLPVVPEAKLTTTLAAHLTDERDVPTRSDPALEIVLRTAREEPKRVLGTVVDLAGDPVEGAWVVLGMASTKSGARGAFALDLVERAHGGDDAPAPPTLRAVKAGHLPGEVARANDGTWPTPLVVRLGGAPLSIEGRVVDAGGVPIPHAQVWTSNEAHFGYIPIDGGEMAMRAGANIESILRGDPWTHRGRADADGRFTLSGLLPHGYRVHALDQKRMLTVSASFDAGVRNVELRMPEEDVHERFAGVVTSLSGDPLAGVEVVLERRSSGEQTAIVHRLQGHAAKTDAAGRFAFERVARAVNIVHVQGFEFGVTGFERPISPRDDVADLRIEVPLTAHVQVDAGERRDIDRVSALDEHGEKLDLSIQHGQSSYAMTEIELRDGRTEPFSTSEAARTLVLYKGEVEVQRVPLKLARGELNTIRL